MTVKDLIIKMRYDVDDTDIKKISDPEILDSINSSLNMINLALIKMRSSLVEDIATITMVNGIGSLPDNFVSIISVNDDDDTVFRIVGNKIKSEEPTVVITYRFAYPEVALSDDLPTPSWINGLLRKFSTLLLANKMLKEDSDFISMVYTDVLNIVSGREYSNIQRELPFMI